VVGPGPVAVGEPLHAGQDIGFPDTLGQLEAVLEAERLGDDGEELADRGQSEEGEHVRHVVVGVRDVGAHGCVSSEVSTSCV
jgi:hypothetical protein